MKPHLIALCVLAAAAGWLGAPVLHAHGERLPAGPLFDSAYDTLVKADEAREAQDWSEATKSYRDALESYVQLQTRYPNWQPGIVKFRIGYCNGQLEAAMQAAGRAQNAVPTRTPANPDETGVIAEAGAGPVPSTTAAELPVSLPALKATATALLKKGEIDRARSVLMDGMNISPDDPGIRLLVGIVQCQAHDFQDAVQVLQALAVEESGNPWVHMALGTAYFGLAHVKEAAAEVQKALDINPDLCEAHFDLAQILLSTQPTDLEAVRRNYRRALELGCPPDQALDILMQ